MYDFRQKYFTSWRAKSSTSIFFKIHNMLLVNALFYLKFNCDVVVNAVVVSVVVCVVLCYNYGHTEKFDMLFTSHTVPASVWHHTSYMPRHLA